MKIPQKTNSTKEIITEDFFDRLHKNIFWNSSKVISIILLLPSMFIMIIDEFDIAPIQDLPKLGTHLFYLSMYNLAISLVIIILKEINLVKIKNEIKDTLFERDYGSMIVMLILFIVAVFIIGIFCYRFFESFLYVLGFINTLLI